MGIKSASELIDYNYRQSGPICPGSRAMLPEYSSCVPRRPRAQPSSILRVRVSSAHCSAFYQSPAWPRAHRIGVSYRYVT